MSIDKKAFGLSDSLISAVSEALKGGQVKIDKNHNGKIDGQDFKMLRKEEIVDEGNPANKEKKNAAAAAVGAKNRDSQYLSRMNPSVADKIRGREKMSGNDRKQFEEVEQVDEKAVSKAQQHAAGAALATQRGEYDGGKKGGAINRMASMKTSELRKFAGTKTKSLPTHKEEVEQVDELSKKTMGSYIKKASHDVATKSAATGRYADRANAVKDQMKKGDYSNYQQGKKDDATADKMFNKSWKRRAGIAKATDKLTKEEAEQVDELSKATLGSYVNKSAASLGKAGYNAGSTDGTAAKLDPHIHTINKRSAGIKRAVGKLAKEDTQIDELSTDTYHSAAHKAAKKAMGDAQGRSGPIFKKYAGMANKFRDKGMDQEKKEKASKDAKSAKMKAYRADRDKNMEEEIQIDEISKGTLASYGYKAGRQMQGNQPSDPDKFRKRTNREKGSKLAYGKYYGHKVKVPATEEVESVDELSKNTLGNYALAGVRDIASRQYALGKGDKSNTGKLMNRRKGVDKAISKLTKEETDPGFAEAKTMTKVKTTKDIGYKVVDVGPGQKEKIVKAHNWTEPKKKLPNGADYAAQRRKERLAANGRMDEATENPMAKQLAAKKAAIQKTIVQKKMQVMQSKANKQMSSMKEGKCSCTEGKKSMTCETHGDKAKGMKGGKEPILMNPPLRD